MTSFLMNCPGCANLIAKSTNCPNCDYSEVAETAGPSSVSADSVEEFAYRRALHNKHSGISMILRLALGFIGALTTVCWFFFLFFGSVTALIGVVFMTTISAILTCVVWKSDRFYPIELNCPQCDTRLDQLNISYERCPCCTTRLT